MQPQGIYRPETGGLLSRQEQALVSNFWGSRQPSENANSWLSLIFLLLKNNRAVLLWQRTTKDHNRREDLGGFHNNLQIPKG